MWRLGLALLLAHAPSLARADVPPEVERAFAKSEVSAVALVIHRAGCEPCIAAIPSWRSFQAEHRKQGLRVFALVQDPSGRCAPPPMKVDGALCDERGGLARALGLDANDGALFYTFDAALPHRAGRSEDVQQAARAWFASRPRVQFEVRGDRGFAEAFRAELSSITRARVREGATGDINESQPCGRSALPEKLWLRVESSKRGVRSMLAPEGGACLLDAKDAPFDPRRARASAAAAMKDVIPAWPITRYDFAALPSAPVMESVPEAGGEAQGSLALGLRSFAKRWLGTRYRLGADGLEGHGIDGPHFVDRAYQEVLGRKLGTTLQELYGTPGRTIEPNREHPEQDLVPGDLVFFATHADDPRQVMLYLGDGEIAQALEIRGVVIEKLPRHLPDMFWLVARRPAKD